jgi:hypothetical protein
LFAVSGGFRWIVEFDSPTSNKEIGRSGAAAELLAASRELEKSLGLRKLRLVLRTIEGS